MPKTGFDVNTVTVKDDDGNEIDVEKVNDTEYTFMHPGKPTDIYVSHVRTETEQTEITNTFPFDDVDSSMYYSEAVRWAVSQVIVSGMGDGRIIKQTKRCNFIACEFDSLHYVRCILINIILLIHF